MSIGDFFIAYRLPNTSHPLYYYSKEKINVSHPSEYLDKKGFLIQSSENSQLINWFIPLTNQSQIEEEVFFSKLPDLSSNNPQNNTSKEEYEKQFNAILQKINSKELDKVILAKIIKHQSKNQLKAEELFNSLSNSYPECFIFLFSSEETGTWMGATPETLIKIQKDNCYTEALAGTKLKTEHLEWQTKEKKEQGIVAEIIEDNFRSLDIEFTKSSPTVSKAGPVVHLKTSFQFSANSSQIASFISKTHPSPAISGYPKEKSIQFIKENEKIDRRYYTGLIGPVNLFNQTHIFVTLRCMELFEKNIFNLYIGGGITKDSIAEDEWNETENKASTLLNIINQIDNQQT
jgi:isochorismate synthase